MKFHIDFSTLAQTLPVMLWGLGGIVLVMGVIYVVLLLLYKISKKKD